MQLSQHSKILKLVPKLSSVGAALPRQCHQSSERGTELLDFCKKFAMIFLLEFWSKL